MVDENQVVDLTTFTIRDEDVGANAEVSSLEIDDNSYSPRTACMGRFVTRLLPVPMLATAAPSGVDFEQSNYCNFSLVAIDAGMPSMTGTTRVQVMINNVDDISPVFSLSHYVFSVEEENEAPLVIGNVSATDVDSPRITFSLVGTTMFNINPDFGNVSILFSSDRGVATQYQFTVVASDPANNTATATATVNIVAINNDPPVLDLNATALDSNNADTPVVFVEEGQPVVIVTEPIVQDPDDLQLTITMIRIEVANSGNLGNEVLSVVSGPLSNAYITLSSSPGVLVIEPTVPSDISTVHNLLRNIQYQNTEDEMSTCRSDLYSCAYGPSSRTILFSIFDGQFYSNRSAAYVTFQFINDPPVIDLDNAAAGIGFTTQFREGAGPVSIASVDGFTLSDSDDQNLESLTCILTNPLDGINEFIFINGTLPTGLVYTVENHTIQITGVSNIDNYRTALSMAAYNSVTLNPNTAARLVEVTASDGELTSEIAVTTIILQIENQNPRLDLSALVVGVNFTTEFVEEGPPVSLSQSVVLLDEDDVNMLRLAVTLVDSSGTEEVLALDSSLITPPLTYSFVYPTLSVNGIASVPSYRDIIESVTYSNTAAEIGDNSDRLVEFVVTDVHGGESIHVFTSIMIRQVDDNPPVFVPSNIYNFTVDENSPNLTLVGTLEVEDADLPRGSDIPTFTILSASPGFGTSDFFIRNNRFDHFQAEILVNGRIDFDVRRESYTLTVQAASGSFTMTATVYITVENLPDIAPMFTDCPFEFRVSENEATFEPLMPPRCAASDPDNLDNIVYTIAGNEIRGIVLVDIDSNTGELSVVNNINREVIGPQFVVRITISDSTQSTSRNITVIIIGQNEFAPEFSSSLYTGAVDENEVLLMRVVDVDATDEDEGPDIEANPLFISRIIYDLRVVSPATVVDYFTINNVTGEVFQLRPIDYEEINEFQLEVTALDNDPAGIVMYSTVPVVITVRNINDEPPFFTTFEDFIVVSELTPPRTTFFTFAFDDPDSDNLQLQFALPAPSQFLLLATSGGLSTLVPLDADVEPRQYNFTIILTDLDTPSDSIDRIGSISANITIAVQDSNDNLPQFNENVYETSVIENSPNGSSVVTVGATDADYGFDALGAPNRNNELRYFLIDAPVNTFAIDTVTGEITKLRPLDREAQAEYTFTVGVRDNPISGSPLVDTAEVRVTVTDVNEHNPLADPSRYYIFVPEDTSPGTELPTYVEVAWNSNGKLNTLRLSECSYDRFIFFI